MSDERRRELERQAAQGDAEARAKVILDRLRSGELTQDQVRAAAYLGEPAARAALGEGAPEITTGAITWGWIKGLAEWGGDAALLRAAVAAAELVQETWEAYHPGDQRFERALAACRAALDAPSDQLAADRAAALAYELPNASPLAYPPNRAARAMRALGSWLDPECRFRDTLLLQSLEHAYRTTQPAALRQAISDALLPWCVPEPS